MTDRHSPPWWLWPNLLALDAPAVAVVWQRFLAAAFGMVPPVAASACLGLVVWGAYLLDRGLDNRPGRPAAPADRHRFALRHGRGFVAAGGLALLAGLRLAVVRLPPAWLVAGGVVGGLLAGYLLAVHLALAAGDWGKERAVGLVFAAGVSLPLAIGAPGRAGEWGPAVVGFAGLCWLNCRLIDNWERGRHGFPWTASAVAAVGLAAPPAAAPLAGATALLVALYLAGGRVGDRGRRVGADVALLTPLLTWPPG